MKRLICLLMALLLLPLPTFAQEAAEAPAPSIRVLLQRLNLTDRADLTLDGVYTVSAGKGASMAFPKGSEVTVQIRAGELYLFYEGMSMNAGKQLLFTRNASDASESEGIRFAQGGNFYPGDLRLTIESGQLRPVMTLSVEDYLMGVVPYEMSNAFPLEALKAQAVCARTYALSHVDESADHDVVDTTNDQVFKGVDLRDTNAIRAIRETAGLVGMYKGKLAHCYYSASNGGQTELVQNVWSGRGDWDYYAMVDDPFDLENPESIVRKAKLNKDASNLPQDFSVVVASYMTDQLLKQGFEPLPRAFRIDSITGVELGGGKFAEPSRMVDELTITFTWSGRKLLKWHQDGQENDPDEEIYLFAVSPEPTQTPTPSPEPVITPEPEPIYSEFIPVEEPFTLTLPLFPEVIRALNLSISGSDNEIVTLKETDEAFTLEARRYGHGVGMSQRGAQWMAAQYGKTCEEILSFYYPGMTLSRVDAGAAVLPTTQPELAETPAPPATPTPRPTLMPVTGEMPQGAYLASVENIEDDSSLNLRAEPNTAAEILMRLYKHQQLAVLGICDDPAWVKVRTDVIEGYVMLSFLEKVQ
ncbi:MAG: SpoIID/LytB domain-containing protein [Clostridiales bacterium]|nr:SpoIID/LytB domain-containing protein [Clostridiales bacterium]